MCSPCVNSSRGTSARSHRRSPTLPGRSCIGANLQREELAKKTARSPKLHVNPHVLAKIARNAPLRGQHGACHPVSGPLQGPPRQHVRTDNAQGSCDGFQTEIRPPISSSRSAPAGSFHLPGQGKRHKDPQHEGRLRQLEKRNSDAAEFLYNGLGVFASLFEGPTLLQPTLLNISDPQPGYDETPARGLQRSSLCTCTRQCDSRCANTYVRFTR